MSKIGDIHGQNLPLVMEPDAGGRPFPDMVKHMDSCWCCLHPESLQYQLGHSLDRLQLQTLDACLLHNPECFPSAAKRRRQGSLEALQGECYRHLREALVFLEGEIVAGRITWYGVSFHIAVLPTDDAEVTSPSRMLEAAALSAGPGYHFRLLQVPLNLFETGAALWRSETLLRKALRVLTNTPGVSCVLLEIRHPNYVADGMAILKWLLVPDAAKLCRPVANARID